MRIGLAATAVTLALVGLAHGQHATAAIREPTAIPAQPLRAALQKFSADRDLQLIFRTDLVGDRMTAGAVGNLTAEEGLQRLLAGTGLTYQFLDDHTVTVQPAQGYRTHLSTTNAGDEPDQAAPASTWSRFRLAQSDPPRAAENSGAVVEAPSGAAQLEQVVVTAEKREERAQDVPISIVAITGDELQQRQITTLSDLPFAVPGFTVWDDGDFRLYTLRGIGDFNGTGSSVGVYLDEADVTLNDAYQLPLNTYDLERVEVLRGPQGTLFGNGSEGGTIRFITKNPVLNSFGFSSDVTGLFTQEGAPSQRINAVMNVPILDDVLGLRVAGLWDHEGGWINQPAANLTAINGQNKADGRAKILYQPVDKFTLTALAEIYENNGGPSISEDPQGNYTQTFGQLTTPTFREEFQVYNLTLAYDLGRAQLLSSSSFVHELKHEYNFGYQLLGDCPGETYGGCAPITAATPHFDALDALHFHQMAKSEELRINSTGSAPWQWTLGGVYRDISFDEWETYYFALQGPLPSAPFFYNISNESKSRAIFADTSYKFWDRLTLGAGARYFHDDQSTTEDGPLQRATFDSTDPRFYTLYKLTDAVNLYANVGKGFRSGGFNGPGQPVYGPESVWSYEVGVKTSIPDKRLRANLAFFHTDYNSYQDRGTNANEFGTNAVFIYQDAGNVVAKGVEWDLAWRPVENWQVGFNGDYIDTYFTKITLTPATSSYRLGDPLNFVAPYQGNVSLQRDFIRERRSGFARLEYSLQAAEWFRNRSDGPYYFSKSDVIGLLNFQSGIEWNQNFRFGFIIQNLLNDRGWVSPDSVEGLASRQKPRTFGLTFGVKLQ